MQGLVNFIGNWHWYIDAICVLALVAFWLGGSRPRYAALVGLLLLVVAASYGAHFEYFLSLQGQGPDEVVVMRYDPGVLGSALVWAPIGAVLFCGWLTARRDRG